MRLQPSVVRIVLAVAAVVALAACSSSSKSSSAASTTTASVAPTTGVPVGSATTAPVGSTTTTDASTANFNSCLVVTQAEAATAIAESVSRGILGNATVEGGLACVFYGSSAPTPTTPNVAQSDTVRVVVVKGADAVHWFDDYRSKVSPRSISGYGDQAYYDGYASLSVLKGSSYLRIAISPARAAPSLADEERLAAAILPKL
ncbi:MAG: hypothetical protein ACLPVY_13075 [Acidimicrobiia bacterium]